VKIGAKISILLLATSSTFPLHSHYHTLLTHTPAVALIAKEQGRHFQRKKAMEELAI
jgi:hypothetical protein